MSTGRRPNTALLQLKDNIHYPPDDGQDQLAQVGVLVSPQGG